MLGLLVKANYTVRMPFIIKFLVLYSSDLHSDWDGWFPDNVGISVQYARARATASDIFLSLGNTASAVHRRWTAQNMIPESHGQRKPAIWHNILLRGAIQTLLQFRHPDPALVHKGRVNYASLQVLGSWRKLKMKKTGGPGNRMSFSAFIWEGAQPFLF